MTKSYPLASRVFFALAPGLALALAVAVFASAAGAEIGSEIKIEVKTVPATLFLCMRKTVLPDEVAGFQNEAIARLEATVVAAKLDRAGPLQFIGPRWNGPGKPSVYIVAIPVREEKPVNAPAYLWSSPAYRAATVLNKGPASSLSACWDALFAQAGRQGLKGTGPWREVLHRAGEMEAPDNLMELQLGLD